MEYISPSIEINNANGYDFLGLSENELPIKPPIK